MGRHKDPDILKLIQTLKNKGQSGGFVADDEFKILDGLYWIDLLWSYREDHRIFITFEIDRKANDRMLKNLDKIFETTSSEVEKPYHHFLIVFIGSIPSGIGKIIFEKARKKNIHIFEDFRNNLAEHDRLEKELESLKIELPDLISRMGKINSASVVQDTLKGLKDLVPILVIRNQQHPINQSTLTSSSAKTSKMHVSAPSVLAFDSKKYESFALIPIPRKRLTLIIPETSICFDIFLREEENAEELRLFAEACNLPFIFNFKLVKTGEGGVFDIHLKTDLADVVHAKKFEDLIRAIHEQKTIQILAADGRLVAKLEGVESKFLSSRQWYDAISNLAYIQEVTSTRIPCPIDLKIFEKDLIAIQRMRKILETGEIKLTGFGALTLTMKRELLETLIKIQEDLKRIPQLSLHSEQQSEHFLNQELLLGPVTWELSDIIFRDPLEDLRRRISDIQPEVPIEITLLPLSDARARIVYHKWRK